MTVRGLIVLGFGGHARSVGDVAIACGVPHLLFYDANCHPGENFRGHPTTRELPTDNTDRWHAFPAAGNNAERQRQMEAFANFEFISLIAPTAYISADAMIGVGSLIAHHVHVGPLASIGRGCIINTGAIVDHESSIGDFSHVSVNATVAGRCGVGQRVFLCAGSVLIDRVSVADDVTVGAGATVIADLSEAGIYVGTPARRIKP